MTTYIALLRAVNVGGTGKLPMADLKALCEGLGFRRIQTYIASGNVVFDSDLSVEKVRDQLEKKLAIAAGKAVATFLRTAAEMKLVLTMNPFHDQNPKLTYVFFLHEKPAADALSNVRGQADEDVRLGKREIYVYYPLGMGQSKLQIPSARLGTSRNLNTVAKLAEMSDRV